MQRVSVVGNSGSGKSTLARRVAEAIGAPYVELDSIHHLSGWEQIDPQVFFQTITKVTNGDTWVVDGNYRRVVVEGPVWQRADTVVWVDPPRRRVMRQVTARTVRRLVTRQELWNGNREPISNVLSWDPNKSIIRWAWTNHAKYQQRYTSAMSDPQWSHIEFVRLCSRAAADAWIATIGRPA